MVLYLLKYPGVAITILVTLYVGFLGLLTTDWCQTHVVYLHAIQKTWFQDLNVPEIFGFLHNQVTPFMIQRGNSANLYAWHILPIALYREHEQNLQAEPAGFASDFTSKLAFKLLREDPEARLIIHMHGARGTVASGYRTPNYRALSAGNPEKFHVLAFDYRGFGYTPGTPSERGLILDALAAVEWALHVAEIDPSQILIFSQSLGTAVNMAVAEHYVHQNPPIVFAGHILIAPFVDVPTLATTYRIAKTIPILGPFAKFPVLFNYLQTFVQDQWSTKDRISEYVRVNEAEGHRYRLTMIHAEDDLDIPWHHTSRIFGHAVNATKRDGLNSDEIESMKMKSKIDLGSGGSVVEWRTSQGIIREEILKYGFHDVIMGNPTVTLAVIRIFEKDEHLSGH